MLYKGVWGTICGDSWDLQDAAVVCRQLEFEGALAAFQASEFGLRIGQIWLDEVQCGGNESSISECVHRGWGDHDCSYYYTAGVVCRPRSKAMIHLQSRLFKVKKCTLSCSRIILGSAFSLTRFNCTQPRLTLLDRNCKGSAFYFIYFPRKRSDQILEKAFEEFFFYLI